MNALAPPHDMLAEQSVLGGVFIKPTSISEVRSILRTDDFLLPAHREIYNAICDVQVAKSTIDVLLVADELRVRGALGRLDGGEGYLMTLSNSVPTAENIGHYARLVREKATLRRLIAACAEIQSRAHGDFGDFDDFIAEATAQVGGLRAAGRGGPIWIGAAMDRAMDNIERKAKTPEGASVKIGLRDFDLATGGLFSENMIVIAARPAGGKSAFAFNACVRAGLAGIPSLFFSCEMSLQELLERCLAFASGIENSQIRRGALSSKEMYQVAQAARRMSKLPVHIDTTSTRIDMIEFQTEAWRSRVCPVLDPENPPLALFAVDYLQKVRTDNRRLPKEERISDISGRLKELARREKMPLLALAQLNREIEKEPKPRLPRLSDLRDSGSIEQDADVVVFLHNDPKRGDIAVFAKQRSDSGKGSVPLEFRKQVAGFFDRNDADEEILPS